MILSKEQKDIVVYKEGKGALLVEAAPGSGKTRVLTERVRYLLSNVKGNFKILCLTFTIKAAEEMKERLSDIRKIDDRVFIGTIHSFCIEILKSRKHELGFDEMPHILEREEDRRKLLEQVFIENEIFKPFYENKPPKEQRKLISNYLDVVSEAKRNLTIIDEDTYDYSNWSNERLILFKEYNNLLRTQNFIDYDDILLLAYRILVERPNAAKLYRKIYKYILVDEAQDLNFTQYQIIKALCGDDHENILMVGDPNQAIYAFNGSGKEFMQKNFVEDFGAEKKVILKNYRSSRQVINYANGIIPNSLKVNEDAFFEGEVIVQSCEDQQAEAKWVFDKIKSLIGSKDSEIEGLIKPDNIAVLARNRFVFIELEKELSSDTELAEKYHLKKGIDRLEPESNLMKSYDLGTRLLANSSSQIHLKQLLNLLKIPSQSIDKSGGFNTLSSLKAELTPELKNEFECLLQAWQLVDADIKNFLKALDLIEESLPSFDFPDDARALTVLDITDWRESWKRYLLNSKSSNRTLANFRRFVAMGYNQGKTEFGFPLGTVHTVKGLEFDIVFLMGMTEGTFPDYRALNDPKKLNEEKNNAYVAVTRARRKLFISYPLKKTMPWGDIKSQKKSRFIK